MFKIVLSLALSTLATVASTAQDTNCSAYCGANYGQNFSSTVPNVLLIGDSISAVSSGYYANVVQMIAQPDHFGDQLATVHHMGAYGPGICGTSYGVVACMDKYLAKGGWKVIHFNWGLHDICASMYAPVTGEQYIDNMKIIIDKMRKGLAPNGTLVWPTTTPVPPSYHNRNNTDVVRINGLMKQLLAQPAYKDVLTNDLYSQVVQNCNNNPKIDYPEKTDCSFLQSHGVHFSEVGKQYTGLMSAAAILPHL